MAPPPRDRTLHFLALPPALLLPAMSSSSPCTNVPCSHQPCTLLALHSSSRTFHGVTDPSAHCIALSRDKLIVLLLGQGATSLASWVKVVRGEDRSICRGAGSRQRGGDVSRPAVSGAAGAAPRRRLEWRWRCGPPIKTALAELLHVCSTAPSMKQVSADALPPRHTAFSKLAFITLAYIALSCLRGMMQASERVAGACYSMLEASSACSRRSQALRRTVNIP